MKGIIWSVLLLLCVFVAQAQKQSVSSISGWAFTTNTLGRKEVFYVKEGEPTVTKEGYKRQWVKVFAKEYTTVEGYKYNNVILLEYLEVDCENYRLRYLTLDVYSAGGTALYSHSFGGGSYNPIKDVNPGVNVDGALANSICGYYK